MTVRQNRKYIQGRASEPRRYQKITMLLYGWSNVVSVTSAGIAHSWIRYDGSDKASYLWYHNNRERALRTVSVRYRRIRMTAMARVAARWGDTVPRCRFDTLPSLHPLYDVRCYGRLEIDHINGGGRHDHRDKQLTFKIASGYRGVHDLRILCRLHQLWNLGDE
mgnify:CR=1 FL=1